MEFFFPTFPSIKGNTTSTITTTPKKRRPNVLVRPKNILRPRNLDDNRTLFLDHPPSRWSCPSILFIVTLSHCHVHNVHYVVEQGVIHTKGSWQWLLSLNILFISFQCCYASLDVVFIPFIHWCWRAVTDDSWTPPPPTERWNESKLHHASTCDSFENEIIG